MKKVWKVLLFSGLLAASTLFAAGSGDELSQAKAGENSVRRQLTKVLSGVANEVSEEEVVFVYFNVTPNKGFEVFEVTGTDPTLVSKVKYTLKRKNIDVSKVQEGKYFVKIRFVDLNSVANSKF